MATLSPITEPETARLEAVLRTIHARSGYLTDETIALLASADRLRQVLVRCNGCRFLCAAQDARHLINLVETGKDEDDRDCGDYVRDVSMPCSDLIYKGDFTTKITQDPPVASKPIGFRYVAGPEKTPIVTQYRDAFNETACSGVFDGFGVVSDADPGL